MKKLLTILVCIVSLSNFAQLDSVYYYNPDGTRNWWYVQQDVFTFGCTSDAQFNGTCSPTIVNQMEYKDKQSRKINYAGFTSGSTPIQRNTEKANIWSSGQVEYSSLVVTKDPTTVNDRTAGEAIETNDLILVNFKPTNVSPSDLNAFISRHSLKTYWTPPSTLPTANWTYVFQISPEKYANTFDACKAISTSEIGFVTSCEPDMYLFKPIDCDTVSEITASNGFYDDIWHIRNEGNNIPGAPGTMGTFDADANICECWGEGYHGENIKVAVIDFYGFDFDHPDMNNQYITGFNCINLTPITQTTISDSTTWWNTSGIRSQHGNQVASVIAANPNNQNAVGVAYNSKIIPILIDGSQGDVVIALQKCMELNADVVNMSFTSNASASQQLYINDLRNLDSLGRNGLGTPLIAGSGNDSISYLHYPASFKEVIGVGATDPNDLRAGSFNSPSFGWGGSEGSTYYIPVPSDTSLPYDVVAPGSLIQVSDVQYPYDPTVYYLSNQLSGTSFAAPIVSGIAAILLSKDSTLTTEELRSLIKNSAVQLPGYNYNLNTNWPGYNSQTFYGRVSCIDALLGIESLSVEETEYPNFISYLLQDQLNIFLPRELSESNSISAYDLQGRTIYSQKISSKNQNHFQIDVSNWSKGLYIITVSSDTFLISNKIVVE